MHVLLWESQAGGQSARPRLTSCTFQLQAMQVCVGAGNPRGMSWNPKVGAFRRLT